MAKQIIDLGRELRALRKGLKSPKVMHDIGDMAVGIFKKNFQEEGFDKLRWKTPQRKKKGKGADKTRKTLTGKTADLGRSIYKKVEGNVAHQISDVVYAKNHNEGITVPKRKFMGKSKRVTRGINKIISKIIQQYA